MLKPSRELPGVLILGSLLSGAAFAETGDKAMPPRQLLLAKPVELPSTKVETRVIRVQFPSGYKTPLHTHEGPGPRYVLKGRLRVEDAGQTLVYGPGDVFWETGAAMTVENIGGGDAEMVIVELKPVQ